MVRLRLLAPHHQNNVSRSLLCFTSVALLGGLVNTPVSAGVNEGGTLILHTNEQIVYSSDDVYCGQSGLTFCMDADTMVDGTEPAVFFLLGAFHPDSFPRVLGVTFGLDYDANSINLLNWGPCGDFELPTTEWPAPGEGSAVTWNSAQTNHLLDVYWFATYSDDPATIALTPHPSQGAFFADDSIPSRLDEVAALGSLGFGIPGELPCAGGLDPGACEVIPHDALHSFLVMPDDPVTSHLETLVRVRTTSGVPIANSFVRIEFVPEVFLCASAVLTGVTDQNGEVHLVAAGGNCVIDRPGAVLVYADDVLLRSFDNVRSPDFDRVSGDGKVDLSDLVSFSAQLFGVDPPLCHDYDLNGDVDLGDFVIFGSVFVPAAHCGR